MFVIIQFLMPPKKKKSYMSLKESVPKFRHHLLLQPARNTVKFLFSSNIHEAHLKYFTVVMPDYCVFMLISHAKLIDIYRELKKKCFYY